MLLCQSGKFRGSDEGEIGGIEEQDGPAFVFDLVLHAEFPEVVGRRHVGIDLEVRNLLPEPNGVLHHIPPPVGAYKTLDCATTVSASCGQRVVGNYLTSSHRG